MCLCASCTALCAREFALSIAFASNPPCQPQQAINSSNPKPPRTDVTPLTLTSLLAPFPFSPSLPSLFPHNPPPQRGLVEEVDRDAPGSGPGLDSSCCQFQNAGSGALSVHRAPLVLPAPAVNSPAQPHSCPLYVCVHRASFLGRKGWCAVVLCTQSDCYMRAHGGRVGRRVRRHRERGTGTDTQTHGHTPQ